MNPCTKEPKSPSRRHALFYRASFVAIVATLSFACGYQVARKQNGSISDRVSAQLIPHRFEHRDTAPEDAASAQVDRRDHDNDASDPESPPPSIARAEEKSTSARGRINFDRLYFALGNADVMALFKIDALNKVRNEYARLFLELKPPPPAEQVLKLYDLLAERQMAYTDALAITRDPVKALSSTSGIVAELDAKLREELGENRWAQMAALKEEREARKPAITIADDLERRLLTTTDPLRPEVKDALIAAPGKPPELLSDAAILERTKSLEGVLTPRQLKHYTDILNEQLLQQEVEMKYSKLGPVINP